eukprot:jgi/Galph1/3324/GphlegSOOS_G1990.1
MEQALSAVSEKCATEFKLFQQCVSQHKDNWEEVCRPQKADFAKCTSENMQFMDLVREGCFFEIRMYEKCLQENRKEPNLCENNRKRVVECGDAVILANQESEKDSTEK